jgi:hypothetical protein
MMSSFSTESRVLRLLVISTEVEKRVKWGKDGKRGCAAA